MSLYPFLAARLKLTLANPPLEVKPVALAVAGTSNVRSRNQQLAARTKKGAQQGPCYTSRFPMNAKSHQGKKSNRKVAGVQMIAHAVLPTRYGRFTIYGVDRKSTRLNS